MGRIQKQKRKKGGSRRASEGGETVSDRKKGGRLRVTVRRGII